MVAGEECQGTGPGNLRASEHCSPAISFFRSNVMRRMPNVEADQPPPTSGTVTGIIASPRAPGRFTVMVDDRAAHTLGLAALERLGIFVGATTLGREETIAREEAILRTYDRAVTMLQTWSRTQFGTPDRWREALEKRDLPFGRMGTSREVADAVVFLASNRAAYISGTVVTVDGGNVNR